MSAYRLDMSRMPPIFSGGLSSACVAVMDSASSDTAAKTTFLMNFSLSPALHGRLSCSVGCDHAAWPLAQQAEQTESTYGFSAERNGCRLVRFFLPFVQRDPILRGTPRT